MSFHNHFKIARITSINDEVWASQSFSTVRGKVIVAIIFASDLIANKVACSFALVVSQPIKNSAFDLVAFMRSFLRERRKSRVK